MPPASIARVFSILRKADYRGYVALEYEGKQEPKQAVAGYIKKMQAAAGGEAA